MTLRQKQVLFLQNFAKLILWACENGYEVTAGELFRTQEQHNWNLEHKKTRANRSIHQDRMAGDLNLFINGKYITESAKYAPLGKKWCSLHAQNRWGGDFNENGLMDDKFQDGNHFEMQMQ